MKRKHGPKAPTIKVIADPKKLAWLKAEIEKQKARVRQRAAVTEVSRSH
jgi:hypothetical protein